MIESQACLAQCQTAIDRQLQNVGKAEILDQSDPCLYENPVLTNLLPLLVVILVQSLGCDSPQQLAGEDAQQ